MHCVVLNADISFPSQVIEGWFLDLPISQIHHNDVAMWTAWAFFGQNVEDMSAEEKVENDTYVAFLGKTCNWSFPPGLSFVICRVV